MFVEDDEFIVRCGCKDMSHPIWFTVDRDTTDAGAGYDDLAIALQIPDGINLWQRIKNCVIYLFEGHQRFWSYGSVVLNLKNKVERDEIVGLHAYLGKVLDQTDPVRIRAVGDE